MSRMILAALLGLAMACSYQRNHETVPIYKHEKFMPAVVVGLIVAGSVVLMAKEPGPGQVW